MKYYLFTVLILLTLTGCGGGDSGSGSSGSGSVGGSETNMIINQPYTVNSGDRIVKTETPSLLHIQHTDGQPFATVTLTDGSAKIIRKP